MCTWMYVWCSFKVCILWNCLNQTQSIILNSKRTKLAKIIWPINLNFESMVLQPWLVDLLFFVFMKNCTDLVFILFLLPVYMKRMSLESSIHTVYGSKFKRIRTKAKRNLSNKHWRFEGREIHWKGNDWQANHHR